MAVDPGGGEDFDASFDGRVDRPCCGGHAHITGERRIDDGRCHSVDADETEAGHDTLRRQEFREGFDVTHAVLQRQDEGGRAEQGAEQPG